MINAAIIGATGYVGLELIRLLLCHPNVKINRLVSSSAEGKISEIYPSLKGYELPPLTRLNISEIAKASDIIFCALPHGASKDTIASIYSVYDKKIIDLSADFRYDDAENYALWYKQKHGYESLLSQAVYGLPELHKNKIKSANLVGNPGCYTTCSILALAPLVSHDLIDQKHMIIDAKSGATGGGRALSTKAHFCELDENMRAYSIGVHRHTSEIEQELGKIANAPITLSFTPHLLPIKRGILATCYADLKDIATADTRDSLVAMYQAFYKDAPFVEVYASGTWPEIKHVVGSNKCAIGICVDQRLNRVIVISCIDNLIKGAAGQAIQNMNIMFDLPETSGLNQPALYI